jgi:hypothetical protein
MREREQDAVEELDDEAIRTVVERLSRPHPSGGAVIERAAILAEGAHCAAILAWIELHAWEPEEAAPAVVSTRGGGLYGTRRDAATRPGSAAPRRYVRRP